MGINGNSRNLVFGEVTVLCASGWLFVLVLVWVTRECCLGYLCRVRCKPLICWSNTETRGDHPPGNRRRLPEAKRKHLKY